MQLLIIFGDLRRLFLAISSGQIKACMTSKQYTFENNVTLIFILTVGRFSRREIKFHGD